MEDKFKQLVNDTIKPMLKKAGFRKKALNFYKKPEDLFFLINFQKSHGNSSAELGFYINCAIHSHTIDAVVGNEKNEFPKEYQCHFRQRIENIVSDTPAKFIINRSTKLTAIRVQLAASLEALLAVFDTIKDTETFIKLLTTKGTLQQDAVFRYCLRQDMRQEAANLAELFQQNIDDERWENIFKERFIKILEEEGGDKMAIQCLQ